MAIQSFRTRPFVATLRHKLGNHTIRVFLWLNYQNEFKFDAFNVYYGNHIHMLLTLPENIGEK